MILKSIDLINYRLHKRTSLEFSDQLNYIIGGNGQGKTSLLEAIYYLSTSKNLSQSSDSEVITFNEKLFEVKGKFKDLTENIVSLLYKYGDNRKTILIDEKNINRGSELIGRFPVVSLTPTDHTITLGAPADRRKFIDSVISQASATYLKILIDYKKTLRQRSSLLYQIRETNQSNLLDQLDVWTETLINQGVEIIEHRIKFISDFTGYINGSYKKIMDNLEHPSIEYKFLNRVDSVDIKKQFKQEIEEARDLELIRGKNLIGPHRDEFIFKINDLELRKFGSQGQHKTFQIALRFGEFFYLKETMGKTPIFLMDDVFGELDAFRAERVSSYMKEIGQAFITLTDFSNFSYLSKSKEDLIINVNQGQIAYA